MNFRGANTCLHPMTTHRGPDLLPPQDVCQSAEAGRPSQPWRCTPVNCSVYVPSLNSFVFVSLHVWSLWPNVKKNSNLESKPRA